MYKCSPKHGPGLVNETNQFIPERPQTVIATRRQWRQLVIYSSGHILGRPVIWESLFFFSLRIIILLLNNNNNSRVNTAVKWLSICSGPSCSGLDHLSSRWKHRHCSPQPYLMVSYGYRHKSTMSCSRLNTSDMSECIYS